MFTVLSLFALSNAKASMTVPMYIHIFLVAMDIYWTLNMIKFIRCTIAILAGG